MLGHFIPEAGTAAAAQYTDCVMVVNDDPVRTRFALLDFGGVNGTAAVREVDESTGELIVLVNDAPDVAGFSLFFMEGASRLFCWPVKLVVV